MSATVRSLGTLEQALLVPRAFFTRDRRIETSYRAGLILRLASAFATVMVFFFLSRTFDAAAPGLTGVGTSYFGFVLLGIVAQEFLSQGIGAFGGNLRESQTTGTLELMLLGPSRLITLLLSSTLWLQASAVLGATTYLVFGVLLGVDLSRADWLTALLGLAIMVVGITGMGFLAGAVVLVVKRGNPLGWALRGASVVLGGTLYPIDVLPVPLQVLGQALPITNGLIVIRGALLEGRGATELVGPLVLCALVSAAFLVVGLAACEAAIRHARSDGSLAQY